MKRLALLVLLACTLPASAQEAVTPASIIAAAPAADWVAIDPADLMVMDLGPHDDGNARRVVIQLMPAPFSQDWVGNIRKLAAARWWDGTSVYRVQDNYVVQWGDVTEEKAPTEGLKAVSESEYSVSGHLTLLTELDAPDGQRMDPYAPFAGWDEGWPLAGDDQRIWPVHCYGMVGVARDLESTGTGSDLYVVIGQAPRQLDRNIALVGRVIEGVEHLSSLPRGKGELGFYDDDEAERRVPILSVRIGAEALDLPRFEYLSTESDSFAAYAHSRANRQDEFYKVPAGGVDICNVPVPIRRVLAQ